MEQQASQKQLERKFVDHFLEILGESRLLNSIQPDERPDFVLGSDGKLGLEVVELFRDPDGTDIPPQAQDGAWNSVARGCAEHWIDRALPNVEVWLGFHSAYHIEKRRVRDVADAIAGLVEEHLPAPGQEIRVHSVSLPYGRCPSELSYFAVSRLVNYERSDWHVDGPGIWVEELQRDKIQRRIDKKNQLVPIYRQKASEVWLLVVAHGWRNSSIMDVPEGLAHHTYSFDFDRVYLLDTFRERVHELVQHNER